MFGWEVIFDSLKLSQKSLQHAFFVLLALSLYQGNVWLRSHFDSFIALSKCGPTDLKQKEAQSARAESKELISTRELIST